MHLLTWQWNHWAPAWMDGVSLGVTHKVSSSLPPLSSLLCKCLSCLCNSPSAAAFAMGCLEQTKMGEGLLSTGQLAITEAQTWFMSTRYNRYGEDMQGIVVSGVIHQDSPPIKQRLRTLVLTLLQEWWWWWEAEDKKLSQWIVRLTRTKGLNES